MRSMPATVVSTALEGPLNWPNATVVSGDAADVVARLKEESELPLRSHGSLSMNRALMAAGLVDRALVTRLADHLLIRRVVRRVCRSRTSRRRWACQPILR